MSDDNPDDVERLQEANDRLENGTAQELLTPIEATDVGEYPRPNPRASDLGYPEACGTVQTAANIGGTKRMMYDGGGDVEDPPLGDMCIECDAEAFVDDVTDWA